MLSRFGEIGRLPARLLFPPICQGCDAILTEPGTLCPICWSSVRFLEEPWCAVLGVPFAHDLGDGIVSADAIANPPDFDRARSAVVHDGVARRIAQALKYNDRTDLAPSMARWIARAGAELVADADLVIAVPLHRRRFLSRRFNQSAELARALARLAGKPLGAGVVLRTRHTHQQVGLTARERDDNVRGAFAVPKEREIDVRGRRILVVDDVFTTGATVSAVARALKRKGAAGVDVLTFSRVMPGDALG
ncbi:MAG: ComF family protein [Phyllobacteriaceae bacterium]|nr:ComF family protein [Phyllobacteriaceae bacterium]